MRMDKQVREEKAVTQIETLSVEEEKKHWEEVNTAAKPANIPNNLV